MASRPGPTDGAGRAAAMSLSGLGAGLALEGLVVLWIALRSVRLYRGQPYVLARIVGFPVLTLLVYALTALETVVTIPGSYPLWVAADAGLLVAAALVTPRFAGRFIQVYQDPARGWCYRYGFELIGIYLGLWVVRLALETYFDPAAVTVSFGPGVATLGGVAATVMQAVQSLFAISTGIVVGRALATYELHRRATTGTGATGGGGPSGTNPL